MTQLPASGLLNAGPVLGDLGSKGRGRRPLVSGSIRVLWTAIILSRSLEGVGDTSTGQLEARVKISQYGTFVLECRINEG